MTTEPIDADGPDWTVRLTEAERVAVVSALEAKEQHLAWIADESDGYSMERKAEASGELRKVRRVLAKVSE